MVDIEYFYCDDLEIFIYHTPYKAVLTQCESSAQLPHEILKEIYNLDRHKDGWTEDKVVLPM